MTRPMRRIFVALAAFVVVAAGGVAAIYFYALGWLHQPIADISTDQVYEVPRGAALGTVLNDMKSRGWIRYPRELSWWLNYSRPGFSLKAGEYEVRPGMSPAQLLDLLGSGKVLLHKLTIVEGSTLHELRQALAAQPELQSSSQGWSDAKLLSAVAEETTGYPNAEGLFYPDTYRFAKGTTDLEILKLAHQRMTRELDSAWNSRDPGLPLASAYEALILASIVEKESALARERPIIAGVFVERLRRGMRLQTDPTIIYGLGTSFDGNLRRADLRRDGPYNTYTRAGLPPTPICLPGREALQAVVKPQLSGALFFVASGRGDGSHYFSRTIEEHNAALGRYLQTLRQRR